MAKYKVTGKISKPDLGVAGNVTASKVIEAGSEQEAMSKAKKGWERVYGYIIKNGDEIGEVMVASL